MFKRREIYQHLTNAAERMTVCANTLHDIAELTGAARLYRAASG